MRKPTWMAPLVCAALLAVSPGCDDKEKKDLAAAELQKREADQKAAEEKRQADEKAAATKREVEQQAQKLAAEGRASVKKDMDAADRKIAYLKEKSAKATGTAKKNAEASLVEVEKRRQAVATEYTQLESSAGATWDAAKTRATAAIEDLNKAVENLESTVSKK